MPMGTIHLEKGSGQMTLQASEIQGNGAIDFRLMMFNRKE